MNSMSVTVDRVDHTVRLRSRTLTVLRDVSFSANAGELVAVSGRSGSGKSTLCNLVAGLTAPTTGRVMIGDRPAHTIRDWSTTSYQPQHLAIEAALTVDENIAAAMLDGATTRREELLERLALGAIASRVGGEVSIGERQRVAIARAVAAEAQVIVLDEPTSSQDAANVERVIDVILRAAHKGSCIIAATHDPRLLSRCDTVVPLADGTLAF
jgi:putative ABC transport system ATP-binding protein